MVGAGVMGAGIAAQVANAGVPVVLLDIVPGGAAKAVERMLRADPAPFMGKSAARLVQAGDLDGGGLPLLADCDWIVEAIVERPDAKRDLYARLGEVRKPGSIVSSNTSTIPLAALTQGLGEGFARDFLITHFFNPPRYMRLLELVRGPATRADAVEAIAAFGDRRLGKTIVHCKDTPGFIANRIGGLWMQSRHQPRRGPPPDGGGGGRGDGPADGRAEDRRVRPARPGRPRPDAACRRLHEGVAAGDGRLRDGDARARAHHAHDRGRAHRPEGRQGRLLRAREGAGRARA